ncbi:hypothetical protein Tco_0010974 [Tanacetum coccineum]
MKKTTSIKWEERLLDELLKHIGRQDGMLRSVVVFQSCCRNHPTLHLASRSADNTNRTPPLLSIPLPTSSPPLLLPSTNCRVDVPEVTLPPRKRFCIAPGPRYEIGESSSAPTTRVTGGFRADYV